MTDVFIETKDLYLALAKANIELIQKVDKMIKQLEAPKKPELTYEEFCSQRMYHSLGMTFGWGSHRAYRNDELGIQKEVITRRVEKDNIYSGWHDGEAFYFLDGDKRQFNTLDQLYVAYMEQVCEIESAI